MIRAKVIAVTAPVVDFIESPEGLISYCARVSNPSNQTNFDTSEKLLQYCVRNQHWSVFEMCNAVVEVECPRDIARQLLRHRSFSFQEFSQRYSSEISFANREARLQDTTNRQNSIHTDEDFIREEYENTCAVIKESVDKAYQRLLQLGVAKECARVILPEGLTMSKLYVNGTLRSWIHYLNIRDDPGVTQWEHVQLARAIKEKLLPHFPTVLNLNNQSQ